MTAVLETFSRQYGNMVWKSALKMKTVQTDQDICQNGCGRRERRRRRDKEAAVAPAKGGGR